MSQTLDLLAFGAHPDDVEIGMGGTLALHASQGFRTGICDLTLAELSSNGTVERRQKEAEKASQLLALEMRENLNLKDRELYIDQHKVAKIVDVIRTYQPKIIFAPYMEDRHPDHGHCSRLIEEAFFSSGIRRFKGEKNLEVYRPEALYFYFINGFHQPDFVVDITEVQSKKMTALSAYESQFVIETDSVATPLTNGYLETVEYRDRLYGKESGVPFAEAFKSKGIVLRKQLLGDTL